MKPVLHEIVQLFKINNVMKTKLSNYVLHAKSINIKDFNILGQYGVN